MRGGHFSKPAPGVAAEKIGKTNEALMTLAKGVEFANARLPKAGKGSLDDQWNDWIIAHALMREARMLIQSDSPSADHK